MGRNSTPASIRASVYCRISLARFGDTVKVDDQERICRDLAAARGWTVDDAHVFKDNSVSAWRRDRKRPGWDAMLGAIERGEVGAIVVYHGDRLIRQPWDLEMLLRLAGERRTQLASPTGSRDLSNPDDQFILRIEVAAQCREVDATSRRTKRAYDRLAERGIVRLGGRGGRAFGFEADGLTVREADAEMLREAAERVLRGESVGAICRDLNQRGFRTTTGGEFGHGSLSKLLQRPRLAGLVAHNGRIVGPAAWEPILDRDTWEQVCAALAGKAEALGFAPTNERKYLLSGLAVCGSCSVPMVARHDTRFVRPCPACRVPVSVRTSSPSASCDPCGWTGAPPTKVRGPALMGYGCINPTCERKVYRSMRHLDRYVSGAVVALLGDPEVRRRLTPRTDTHLVVELERLEAQQARVEARYSQSLATGDEVNEAELRAFRNAIASVEERIGDVRRRIGESVASRTLEGLFGVTPAEFEGLSLSRRRAAVGVLLRPVVLPTGRRGPTFDPSGVRLDRAY